jgi:hypothetical protein
MNFFKKNFVDSSFYLNEQLASKNSFGCGKIGNCELMCIYNYFVYIHQNTSIQWSSTVIEEIYNNAGVFPKTEQARIEFIEELQVSLKNIDSLASWSTFNPDFESRFIKKNSFNCELIDLQSIEPFYSGTPWTEHLESKNVLVISPFTDTIRKQYEKRHLIWEDQRVLPTFKELLTLKHPHSPGIDIPSKYNSWLDMVRSFKDTIDTIDYDVLLVGAGASSLPLVAHAKKNGKKAVHLGGPLQLLFGIKGGRWDTGPISKHFYNEHWVKPINDETPKNHLTIENGCYW